MKWKYCSTINNKQQITSFLAERNVVLPHKLINVLESFNGGTPEDDEFFTYERSMGYCFKCLLSFNENDCDNVYEVINDSLEERYLFPFAMDGAGNLICYSLKEKKYILFVHETMAMEEIKMEGIFNQLV